MSAPAGSSQAVSQSVGQSASQEAIEAALAGWLAGWLAAAFLQQIAEVLFTLGKGLALWP